MKRRSTWEANQSLSQSRNSPSRMWRFLFTAFTASRHWTLSCLNWAHAVFYNSMFFKCEGCMGFRCVQLRNSKRKCAAQQYLPSQYLFISNSKTSKLTAITCIAVHVRWVIWPVNCKNWHHSKATDNFSLMNKFIAMKMLVSCSAFNITF
jgi:hypothetical protein